VQGTVFNIKEDTHLFGGTYTFMQIRLPKTRSSVISSVRVRVWGRLRRPQTLPEL